MLKVGYGAMVLESLLAVLALCVAGAAAAADGTPKVGTSENNIENSGTKVGTSKRLKFEELQSIIMSIAEDYITINEIAKKVDRTIDYIANKIIPKMIKNGTIEHLYPGIPNHPKQKYKATNKRTNN